MREREGRRERERERERGKEGEREREREREREKIKCTKLSNSIAIPGIFSVGGTLSMDERRMGQN